MQERGFRQDFYALAKGTAGEQVAALMSDLLAKEQQDAVAKWVAEGASLSEIQKRINAEFGVSITYMALRFLVDDLGVALVDKTPPAPPAPPLNAPAAAAKRPQAAQQAAAGHSGGVNDMLIDDDSAANAADADPYGENANAADADDFADAPAPDAVPPAGAGNVSITVDVVQRPGEIASGSVTFSDGQSGQWFLDSQGRLGFEPPYKGYQPTPADVRQFQISLQRELSKGSYGAY